MTQNKRILAIVGIGLVLVLIYMATRKDTLTVTDPSITETPSAFMGNSPTLDLPEINLPSLVIPSAANAYNPFNNPVIPEKDNTNKGGCGCGCSNGSDITPYTGGLLEALLNRNMNKTETVEKIVHVVENPPKPLSMGMMFAADPTPRNTYWGRLF